MDPIYRRTALFYRTLMRAGTQQRWTELMDSTEANITVDADFAARPGAQRLLVTLCVILARCFGTVSIGGEGIDTIALRIPPVLVPEHGTLAEACRALIAAIQGTAYQRPSPQRRLTIHVGPRPRRRASQVIVASGWRATLFGPLSAPQSFEGEPNPAGAILGALMAATSVVRSFLEQVTTPSRKIAPAQGRLLVDRRLYERYAPPLGVQELSAYDLFGLDPEPDWRPQDLAHLTFVSLGAVNGALYFAMLIACDLNAVIHAFEPQRLHRTDENRYWYAIDAHRRRYKVAAAKSLATHRIRLEGQPLRLSAAHPPFREGALVISGADNDEARHLAQRLARGALISLSTEGEQVCASFHTPSAPPCAACLHPGGAAPGGVLPTHPVVSGWAGLLGLQALLARPSWDGGRQVRLAAFRPADRHDDQIEGRADCPVCHERAALAIAEESASSRLHSATRGMPPRHSPRARRGAPDARRKEAARRGGLRRPRIRGTTESAAHADEASEVHLSR